MNLEILVVFWCIIATGFIIRFIKAPKGKRIRRMLKPGFDAIDTYQENLIGKTGAKQSNEMFLEFDDNEKGIKD